MKLTKHFYKEEFDSKDGEPMPSVVFVRITKLASQLQALRNEIGKPIQINSGYRSKSHNKSIGGVDNSQHVLGNAADLSSKNATPQKIYDTIEKLILKGDMLQGGLGLYDTFVHYDIGYSGKRRRWDNRKKK
jgi:uncharacterized protein YcbK (DUF882 family)